MIFIKLFLFIFLLSYHPVHVSVTSMEYESENKSFLVSFKVFTDDFETIVKRNYNVEMNLGKKNENYDAKEYFNRYFQKSFSCMIDGIKLQDQVFIRKKMNDVAVWFYYRYPVDSEIKDVEINNRILLDMFSDQSNLLIFKYNDFEEGFIFDKDKTTVRFQLD